MILIWYWATTYRWFCNIFYRSLDQARLRHRHIVPRFLIIIPVTLQWGWFTLSKCIWKSIHTYMSIYTYICMYYIYIHRYNIYVYIYMCVHMYTYIYICVLIHMHMYTIYTRDYIMHISYIPRHLEIISPRLVSDWFLRMVQQKEAV